MTGWRNPRLARQQRRGTSRRTVPWAAVLALLAFSLRGLIPLGFEPADGSLTLALCHEGFPAHFFSQGTPSKGRRPGHGGRESHCLYCNGTSPAPAFSLATVAHVVPVSIGVVQLLESDVQSVRHAHIPQARAPPHLA